MSLAEKRATFFPIASPLVDPSVGMSDRKLDTAYTWNDSLPIVASYRTVK